MKKCRCVAVIVAILGYFLLMILTPHLYSVLPTQFNVKPLMSDRVYNFLFKIQEEQRLDVNVLEQELSIKSYIPNTVVESIDEKVRLSVLPLVADNGGVVTLEWGSVHNNSLIGLYCPSHSSHFGAIDFWWTKDLIRYSHTSTGAKFTLYNVRTDCQFRYFVVETVTKLVAVSSKIHFKDSQKAHLHTHLALTNDHREMRVQWTTGKECVPTVHYGTSADHLPLRATGVSGTYKASDMCGPPANMSVNFVDPGQLHDVLLTNLASNTRYYYQLSGTGISSDVMTFQTPPPPGSKLPLTFITYGDMDITNYSEETAVRVLAEIEQGSSFVLHIGDLSYAVGLAYRWDEWMTLIEPLSSRVPYMVSVGNHEQCSAGRSKKDPSGDSFHPTWGNYGHDSGGECGLPTSKRFHMPDNGNGVWWYSFKYGLTHIIQLSTEHSVSLGSKQYAWLEKELRSVNRDTTPWLIVTGHRPLYNSEMYLADFNVTLHLRSDIEDLLYTHRVDLFVGAHYHAYERMCRVYRGVCVDDGILHVTVGTAGMYLDGAKLWDFDWSKHFEFTIGYGRITVASGNELVWEFVRSKDGVVSDRVALYK